MAILGCLCGPSQPWGTFCQAELSASADVWPAPENDRLLRHRAQHFEVADTSDTSDTVKYVYVFTLAMYTSLCMVYIMCVYIYMYYIIYYIYIMCIYIYICIILYIIYICIFSICSTNRHRDIQMMFTIHSLFINDIPNV